MKNNYEGWLRYMAINWPIFNYVCKKRLLPKREEPKSYFAVQLLRMASILRQSMITGSLFPSI